MSEGMWTDEKAIAIALVEWLQQVYWNNTAPLAYGIADRVHYEPTSAQLGAALIWLDRMAREGAIAPAVPAPPGGWD